MRRTAGDRSGDPSITSPPVRRWSTLAAFAFLITAMVFGYTKIGIPPVVIVGGSGMAAFVIWRRSYLKQPTDRL